MELEEIRRKILTPRDDEESQEINDIPVIEEFIGNEYGPMEPNETEIHVHVNTETADEEYLIIDELKALVIRNETKQHLLFKKVGQKKSSDATDKTDILKQMI